MSPKPGKLINGHVRLTRQLGRGGMGSVWIARHEKLAIDVAVKFVAAELLEGDDPLVLSRFKREAQLAAKLDSPHTVRMLDHGVGEDGSPYIVMELLQGQSLAEAIQRQGRLAIDDASEIVSQAAEGLEHAHALGVVHRDIKPPNIFLVGGAVRRVKILDFGIAKSDAPNVLESVATSSGVLIGTPQYMSPEQLMRAGPVDKAADLWALAVVAYEMITGRPPFTGETLAATLVAITQAALRPPTEAVPGLSGALDAFFRVALAADPKRRFGSAKALAAAFAAAARGTPPAELPTLVVAPPIDEASLSTAEFLARQQPSLPPEAAFAATEAHSAPPRSPRSNPTPSSSDATGERAEREPGPRSLRARSARRLNLIMGGVALVSVGVAVYAIAGARDRAARLDAESDPALVRPVLSGAHESSSIGPIVAPTGGASGAASSEAPKLASLPRTAIPEGFEGAGASFVPKFEIAREPGDEGATFIKAQRACERRQMSLCSEAQWLRACETGIAVLASRPSWTLSPGDGGLAVRGGAGACSDRAIVSGDVVDPARVGVCCSRSIGVTSSNKNVAFLSTTADKLLKVERLLNAANGSELARLAAIKTNFFGKLMTREELTETASWIGRSSSFYFDSCVVAIRDDDQKRRWTAECGGTQIGGNGAVSVTRWARFDDGGLFDELREPKGPRPLLSVPEPKRAK